MKYFFHVRFNDAYQVDPEGIALPDHETVRREAIKGARELIAEAIKIGGRVRLDATFEVKDERSQIILILPFASVLLDSLEPRAVLDALPALLEKLTA